MVDIAQAWLRTVVQDVTRRLDTGIAEQAPVSLDTILWYVADDGGCFDVYSRNPDSDPIAPDVCGAMREAGAQASYDKVSIVSMSSILRNPQTDEAECRIYACNRGGDMLVRRGAVRRAPDDTITQVDWSREVIAGTVGAGQPFLNAFWQGWEDATAQRN